MKFNWMQILYLVFIFAIQGCSSSDGEEGGISGTGGVPNIIVNGSAEKGPFLKRSEVTYRYIDSTGSSISDDMSSETSDDLGNFSLNLDEAGLLSIRVEGYHFNELSGQVSDGAIALTSLYQATDEHTQVAKVNIMTHLIKDRVLNLMQSGVASGLAFSQAEQELLTALETIIPKIAISDFTQLSIYNNGNGTEDGNTYLLLLSAALYQHAQNTTSQGSSETGQLIIILNKLADDFLDGHLEASSEILSGLTLAIQQLDPDGVITNLKNRSEVVLGEELEVPDFSEYIGQFLITFPAENALLTDAITINTEIPKGLHNITLELLVNGKKVDELTEAPYQFRWNPYFWSGESTENSASRHTILLKASNNLGGELVSNLVNVSVSHDSRNQLNLQTPPDSQEFKNQNEVLLSWEALADAVTYTVQLASDSEFINILDQATVTDTQYTATSLLAGHYFWRIKASNGLEHEGAWSNYQAFSISSPTAPILSTPSDDAKIRDTSTPLLSWDEVSHAESYTVEISQSPNFISTLQHNTTTDVYYTATELPGGSYYWRVKSTDSFGNNSEYTATRSFEITGPAAPTNITTEWLPAAEQNELQVNWSAADYASEYIIEVANDENFLSGVRRFNVSNLALSALVDVGNYFGRIGSVNTSGLSGEWSSTFAFDVGLFQITLGGLNSDEALDIIHTKDGGFLIRAYTKSKEISSLVDSSGDDWIIKLDSQGNMDWQYLYHATGSFKFIDFTEMADGSIVAVGHDWQNNEALAVKLSPNGEQLWETSFQPEDMEHYYRLTEVIEFNGQIYVGASDYGDICVGDKCQKLLKFYLHNISSNGDFISDKIEIPRISGLVIDRIEELDLTDDGKLIIVGYATEELGFYNFDSGGGFIQVLDTELSQDMTWHNIGTRRTESMSDAIQLSDGKFIAIGHTPLTGNISISSINSDGSDHKYVSSSKDSYFSSSIVSGVNGNFYALFRDYEVYSSPHPLSFVAYNNNLNEAQRSYLTDLRGTVIPRGLVRNRDGTFTFLLNQRQTNTDNIWDIIVTRRKM